MEQAESKY